ncbi:hypothetical protein JTE90_011553 [Oedothorax gibbosus]|uniref:Uncharacterized protein n=1 Tax=Oedothorax gibbosus TaxID=931172 RepID=A0AAV6UIN4_9ARAC|nr:hypothetical protein JTE90_011553 [Oedothorax gibbosus]
MKRKKLKELKKLLDKHKQKRPETKLHSTKQDSFSKSLHFTCSHFFPESRISRVDWILASNSAAKVLRATSLSAPANYPLRQAEMPRRIKDKTTAPNLAGVKNNPF